MPGSADLSPSYVGRLIDTLTNYIEANADLPDHNTVRKRAPRVIWPADCPMLLVVLSDKVRVTVATEGFDTALRLTVAWYENAVEDFETLDSDPDLSESLLLQSELIEAAVVQLAKDRHPLEGLVYEVEPAGTSYQGQLLEEGLVEGYALDVLIGFGGTGA